MPLGIQAPTWAHPNMPQNPVATLAQQMWMSGQHAHFSSSGTYDRWLEDWPSITDTDTNIDTYALSLLGFQDVHAASLASPLSILGVLGLAGLRCL